MCAVAVFDSSSLPLVEEMYAKFLADPLSVDPEWKAYFLGWQAGGCVADSTATDGEGAGLYRYAEAWRTRGHLVAKVNPLVDAPAVPDDLKPETYGLRAQDAGPFAATYGGSLGIECGAVRVPAERAWVQDWWESDTAKAQPTREVRLALYDGLMKANAFEKFLHTKFVGAKRFSVEGNDAILPLLLQLVEHAAAGGVKHVVMGMAHRGRLNVLCHVLHKPLADLFAAFADKFTLEGGPSSGDVKYHMGKTYEATTAAGKIELQLLYNPSHLEAVNAMVLGVARAKADALDAKGKGVLPILIHGDSAVAGLGNVPETNNLMGIKPYDVGGTLHFVLNNQVGFTANPADAFAGAYCTDIFKQLGVPIVHVNADDMDACWTAMRFAWAYRSQFGKDVVIDLIGYRRWGHNEGDDPTFTQPLMYEKIREHKVPAELYALHLKANGIAEADLTKLENAYADELNQAFETAQKGITSKAKGDKPKDSKIETLIENGALKKIVDVWSQQPAGFDVNSKVARVVDERVAMLLGEKPLNWGAAETTAYAALLMEGTSVRLTGQDAQRGTFSHRHAVLVSGKDNSKWNVLQGAAAKGAVCDIHNSALSENAVMGFEYGYALGKPDNSLVVWEGQFGDFANGAQVVIDQFISSAEAKWGQLNHLAILLPHGYEGQGPEHSSARLERFLQLCAEDNMRVCYPSTPAQIFHLLRRQAKSHVKKPLVVMTPKSLLRNPLAVSPVSELLKGTFQSVLVDPQVDVKTAKKVVLCTGKIYYDLLARREADKRSDVALVRVEELYPWPADVLGKMLAGIKAKDVYWVQEEPRNQGSWSFVRENWGDAWGYLHYVGRPASASPACGTTSRHNAEQKAVVDEVFGK